MRLSGGHFIYVIRHDAMLIMHRDCSSNQCVSTALIKQNIVNFSHHSGHSLSQYIPKLFDNQFDTTLACMDIASIEEPPPSRNHCLLSQELLFREKPQTKTNQKIATHIKNNNDAFMNMNFVSACFMMCFHIQCISCTVKNK